MTIGKAEFTERFERWRLREPKDFVRGSFRTHDIGRPGFSKRVAGKLKDTGKFATQAFLIDKTEPSSRKRKLRSSIRKQLTRIQQKAMFAKMKSRQRMGR